MEERYFEKTIIVVLVVISVLCVIFYKNLAFMIKNYDKEFYCLSSKMTENISVSLYYKEMRQVYSRLMILFHSFISI